jgi:hypothetical protein
MVVTSSIKICVCVCVIIVTFKTFTNIKQFCHYTIPRTKINLFFFLKTVPGSDRTNLICPVLPVPRGTVIKPYIGQIKFQDPEDPDHHPNGVETKKPLSNEQGF